MYMPVFSSPAPWRPQYFSYAFVAGASLLGLGCPALAPVVLGPVLLVGLVLLGLAHGACDQLVLPTLAPTRRQPARQMMLFIVSYVSLAMLAGLGWWYRPAAAVTAFFLLTVWHWGSADAVAQPGQRAEWLLHSFLRGALFFAVPAWWWPAEAQHSLNGLLGFIGSQGVPAAQFTSYARALELLVASGHLALWGYYIWRREAGRASIDAGEVALLVVLFVTLPPLLAVGTYFVFWHSLQHALRLNRLFGYTPANTHFPAWRQLGREVFFFLRHAWPLLAVSLVGLSIVYLLLPARQWASQEAWLSLALIAAAVLTLPHALLVSVVMDAANWRQAT